MNIGDYQALARRTQNPDLTKDERRQHAIYGLVSEITEFMREDTRDGRIKELGDVCWFSSELCDVEGWAIEKIVDGAIPLYENIMLAQCSVEEIDAGMILAAGAICGAYQKTYQGHELVREYVEFAIRDILAFAMVSAKHLAVEDGLNGIMAANIAKLRRRYPDGFSEERSVNREE